MNFFIENTAWLSLVCLLIACALSANEKDLWVVYDGYDGPGKGKHIVLISGDEEYRSEEALPMLGKILAVHHGFKCTVLFAINPETGEIDPENQTNIPGLEALETADLMILFTRFRELPDEDMKYIIDYTNSGKPVIGLRTATHAFNYTRNKDSEYAKYDFRSETLDGGYGKQVLGETWINHHGHHGREATRGLIDGLMKDHPILKGVTDIFGTTDVYGIETLTGDSQTLVHGQVLVGMNPWDAPDPHRSLMPLAWVKSYTGETGNTARVFCTTMGASVDFENAGLRRLLVNASYWGLGMEEEIVWNSKVDFVGDYKPTFYGFGTFTRGIKPADHKL